MGAFWQKEKSILVAEIKPALARNRDIRADLIDSLPVGSDDRWLVFFVTATTRKRPHAVVVENLNERDDARVEPDALARNSSKDGATLQAHANSPSGCRSGSSDSRQR